VYAVGGRGCQITAINYSEKLQAVV